MAKYDTLVIGAGLAGLVIACRLALAGHKLLLVAQGAGSLLLTSGCVDVLGYQPADSQQPLDNPLAHLDAFLDAQPNHPYHFTGPNQLVSGLQTFQSLLDKAGLVYQGRVEANWHLPGAAGAVRPTCLAPASLAQGDLRQGGKMLIVGFQELRDFYPELISQNLNAQQLGVNTSALVLAAPSPISGKLNVTPIELAQAFEQVDFQQRVARAVKNAISGVDRVGFPAVLGLADHHQVLANMEKLLGRTIFEISTLPPSVPGRRLFDTLRRLLLQAGGQFIMGGRVVDGTIEAGQVRQVRFETVNRLRPIQASHYILASGGLFGSGIQTDLDGNVWEPVFGLPVAADNNRHTWFRANFLDPQGQPVTHYGVQVNDRLNPVDAQNIPIANNLYLAGSVLADADWIAGRTGDGVALATGDKIISLITASKTE